MAIARALSSGAGIILADEPTGNLDTANGNQVMEILLRLAHEEGRCVIVVTHDMDIAAQADEVWRMKDRGPGSGGVTDVRQEIRMKGDALRGGNQPGLLFGKCCMRLVEKHMGYSVRPEICSDYQFSSVSVILLNIKNCIDIIFTNFYVSHIWN